MIQFSGFAVTTALMVIWSMCLTSVVAPYCSSRVDDFTNVCIQKGAANTGTQEVKGAKQCNKTMSATFEILRFDYCQPGSDPCVIKPDNHPHNISVQFTSGGGNITIDTGNVTLKVANVVKKVYNYSEQFTMEPNTQYTMQATWDPTIPPELMSVCVQFEFNMYDTNKGLILCIEGNVKVVGVDGGLVPSC